MTRCFVVDAQLPRSLAARLTECGFNAVHVADLGLLSATDQAIWQVAIEREATIVSNDEDFVVLSTRVGGGPQIVWLRIGNVGNRSQWDKVADALPEIMTALDAGERMIEVR